MATPKAKKGAGAPPADEFRKPLVFQEWEGKVITSKDNAGNTVRSFEKFKMIRDNVVISQEEADAINDGVLHGGNTHCSMYFPAPEKAEKAENTEE